MSVTIAESPAPPGTPDEAAGLKALAEGRPGAATKATTEPECLFRFFTLTGLRRAIRPTLARVVRDVVVPELAGRARPPVPMLPRGGDGVDAQLVDRLTPLLLASDAAPAREFIDRLSASGIALDSILLALMRRAERILEGWFDEDRCSSLDVTLGVCQLRMLALELARSEHREARTCTAGQQRACVLSLAGDTLRFAPVLHECYLQMAGWDIEKFEGIAPEGLDQAGHEVCASDPDLVLFVLNDRRRLESAVGLIREVRQQAGASSPLCIGAGRAFAADAQLPEAIGLDAVVVEPGQTLLAASGCCH